MFLAPTIFWGSPPPPEILDRHYKIWPSADHRAKSHANWPLHLEDLTTEVKKTSALKHKPALKAVASGRLINKTSAVNISPL